MDEQGRTPLFDAESKDIALQLLEAGASVDGRDTDLGTPLSTAISRGRVDVMRVLLHHGASVELDPPLRTAIWMRNIPALKALLEDGYRVDGDPGESLQTPLQYAASLDQNPPEIIEVLLQNGANVEGDPRSRSPLASAIYSSCGRNRDADLLSFRHLIRHGASITYDDLAALLQVPDEAFLLFLLEHLETQFLAHQENPKAKRRLLSKKLWSSCRTGSLELLSALIREGADPNYSHNDELDGTPLRTAAMSCRLDVVTLLLTVTCCSVVRLLVCH